jgi:hypothetical protein
MQTKTSCRIILSWLLLASSLLSHHCVQASFSKECTSVDGNYLCLSFHALTWHCQAEWNGVPCASCRVCSDTNQFPMTYNCVEAANSSNSCHECAHKHCNGKCLGCSVGPIDIEDGEEDPMDRTLASGASVLSATTFVWLLLASWVGQQH